MSLPVPIDLTKVEQPKSTLGCPILDGFLRGGFACGTVTELTGEASAGKTQLVLQSLLTVQLPEEEGGLAGKAVYFYTEGKPPVDRLKSILENRFPHRRDVCLDNVLVESRAISTPEALQLSVRVLEGMLEKSNAGGAGGAGGSNTGTVSRARGAGGGHRTAELSSRPIRLVVIDSVAHVFRDAGAEEAGGGGGHDQPQVQQWHRRATLLFTLAAALKRLADRYGLAVLLTNQIMDDINHDTGAVEMGLPSTLRLHQPGSRAAPLVSSGRRVLPALGLAWANCVNTRLFAARHEGWGGGVIRSLQVVFAPHLPHSYCCFRLDVDGVWGVDDEEDRQQPQPQQPPLQQQPLQPQLQAQQELQPPQHRQQHPAGQVAGCAGAGSQVGLCGGAAVWQGG
ncbi:hypothetical protein CHLRE_06g278151v5 [Chlamydomonas reinhardtii]|uniref:RecA family profile 1 domain-containing protein n=1 Tax=Chlamydomonas reinhardtii TaxID=3055 RepID=A0A2K3DP13_CHLRE|nr:uncharacterized protein CHLRE_06g278151v5 [Chlamydomonas reinhardtii]PNW82260.1 hypothetical protein CHLRE_06g278151v5 [Chlamydomonas reinhardtii]